MKPIIKGENNFIDLNILEKQILKVVDDYLYEKYSNKNTYSCYKRYILRHISLIRIEKLHDLTHIHYVEVRSTIVEFIKSFSAANTKRVVISALRGFWEYLCDVYGYRKNPVPIKMNLPPRQNKSTTKSLHMEKMRALLDKLQRYAQLGFCDHLKYSMVVTLATTGLRISEALQVTTDMVTEGTVVVIQKRESKRAIDLPTETQKILLSFIKKYQIVGNVFQSSKGKAIGRVYAHRLIKQATGISPHGFRKSVIEILIEKGIHNHEVAKVSGHSSINMVFYYDNRDTKAEAHKTLANSLLQEK